MIKTVSAREAALISLLRCEAQGKYSNLELSSAIKKHGLDGAEKALFTRLVYGVIERKITLDHVIGKFSDIPTDKIDADAAMILRIGLYQFYYLDRIPESAIVNEAVESAKKRKKSAAGFVNAILRSAVRAGKKIPLPPETEKEYLSVRYSLPDGLIRMFSEQYGREGCMEILEGIDRVPYTALAVNTLKISREELAGMLTDAGCAAQIPLSPPNALYLVNGLPRTAEEAIAQGLCFVQDVSSQRAVEALSPAPGETLVDVCACPGGKSFYAAILMRNGGRIVSRDLHANKLSLVRNGAVRLGFSMIETEAADASVPDPSYTGIADKVICDVPCSGLGVIAKKPDIRFKDIDGFARLTETQYAIITASSGYLKVGGRLLYSTCTLNKNENESVVQRFLSEHDGFRAVETRTSFPCIYNDGFFHAVIERIN